MRDGFSRREWFRLVLCGVLAWLGARPRKAEAAPPEEPQPPMAWGEMTSYSYDCAAADPAERVVTYVYDSLGRLVSQSGDWRNR